jgi:hypothetical protein
MRARITIEIDVPDKVPLEDVVLPVMDFLHAPAPHRNGDMTFPRAINKARLIRIEAAR